MRSPRLAELVADELRSNILKSGAEGDRLPPQDELLDRFEVGLPSIREALRILEVEGLVTVHRGNVGGATVHMPTESNVAYMAAMVLESRKVGLEDIAATIRRLEPLCAEMCAERPDRLATTVPALEDLVKRQRDSADDPPLFNNLARQFHSLIVANCGNASMALTAGSLVQVWTAHEQSWTEEATPSGKFPTDSVLDIARAHERILAAIRKGDPKAASHLSAAHLEAAQAFHMSVESRPHVMCAPLRYTERRA